MARKFRRFKKTKTKPKKIRPFITEELSLLETLDFNETIPLMDELLKTAMPLLDEILSKLKVKKPRKVDNEYHKMSMFMIAATVEYSKRSGSVKFRDRLEKAPYREYPYKATTDDGYVMLYTYDFKGYRAEHRHLMDKKLGRVLKKSEHVHHIDLNPSNNNISNLMVVSVEEHKKLHSNRKWKDKL